MTSINLDLNSVREQISIIFKSDMHLKRQHSLADAAFGLLNSDSLRLHALGEGLALAKGLNKKHATKQIDRLLSNTKLKVWDVAENWVPYIIGERKEIEVALDWTSFWHDKQKSLCLNLLTNHGRATPLIWQTVSDNRIKYNQGHYEDQILSRLKSVIPDDVKVTVVADRGFASYRFFDFIENELGFNYVIRLKSSTTIISNKTTIKTAKEWLRPDGRALNIKQAKITKDEFPVEQVIITKEKNMKDAWYLASNCSDKKTREIINLYSRRWKIEPYFRDIKDQRFGFGLSNTHIKSTERRDRLLLIIAMAYVLFTLLGAAGEQLGFDRKLKVNTVKTRTHSLIRQGMFYYDFFRHFTDEEKDNLLKLFNSLLENHGIWRDILCAI
jgi:hypothetical protein